MKKVRCVIQKGKTLFYPIIKGSKYKLIDIIEERECGKYDDELLKGTCFKKFRTKWILISIHIILETFPAYNVYIIQLMILKSKL